VLLIRVVLAPSLARPHLEARHLFANEKTRAFIKANGRSPLVGTRIKRSANRVKS
jgi:hypothetical protein